MKRRLPSVNQRGLTLIELMLAIFITAFLLVAMGVIYTQTAEAWREGKEKLDIQQEATFALEQIARDVRASRSVVVASPDDIRCYDSAGTETARYTLDTSGAVNYIHRDSNPLVSVQCTLLGFALSADEGTVDISLELQDAQGNKTLVSSKTTLRNRNLSKL